MTEYLLPPERPARLAGDELTDARLIALFRGSYAASQGRQWAQAHILWWALNFLHRNEITLDLDALDSHELTRQAVSQGLPRGHTPVRTVGLTEGNFGLWWRLLKEFALAVYRGGPLPDLALVEHVAYQLGLRLWMSSSTYEELAGIGRALGVIHEHHQAGTAPDDFMIQCLLPSLLQVETYWLNIPEGRPSARRTHLVFPQRHAHARAKWDKGLRLTVLDHMYLRAWDLATHFAASPASATYPHLSRIADLAAELERVRPPARLLVGGAS